MSGVVSVSSAWYVVLTSSVGSMSRLVISLLGLALFVTSCGEKYVFEMSRNYVPPYNPGGDLFDEDEGFAQSYEVYKQRREDILADVGSGTRELRTEGKGASDRRISDRSSIQKRDVVEKLREYGAVPLDRVESGGKGMINKEGMDLARVEGARFLDVDLKLRNEAPEELEARTPTSGRKKRVSTQSEKAALPGAKSAAQSGGASSSPAAGISSGGKVSVSNVNPPATATAGPDANGGVGAVSAGSNKEEKKGGASSANDNKSVSAGKKAAAKHLQETKKKLSDAAGSTDKRGDDKKVLKGESAKKSDGGGSVRAAPIPVGSGAAPSAGKKKPSAVAPLAEPTSKSKKVAPTAKKSDDDAEKSASSVESGSVAAPVKSASTKAPDPGKLKKLDAGQPSKQIGRKQIERAAKRAEGDVRGKSEAAPKAAPLTKDDKGASTRGKTHTAGSGETGVVGRDFLDSWKFDDDEYEDDYIIQYMD